MNKKESFPLLIPQDLIPVLRVSNGSKFIPNTQQLLYIQALFDMFCTFYFTYVSEPRSVSEEIKAMRGFESITQGCRKQESQYLNTEHIDRTPRANH